MKWTNYYITHRMDADKVVLYNYANDGALFLSNELFELLNKYKADIEALSTVHPDFYKALVQRGFLLDDNYDEVAHVKEQVQQRFDRKSELLLTVNPTMDCNLRCWYCYEEHTKQCYMSRETMESIMAFVAKQMASPELKVVSLSFFGGEPLMKFNSIAWPLICDVKQLCDEKDIEFHLQFTTNGVLLSKDVVDKICSQTPHAFFQIPFDGNRELHNKVKFLSNKKGTYDIVLSNIDYMLSVGMNVTVRCNYDLETVASFQDVIIDVAALSHANNTHLGFSLQKIWQAPVSDELWSKVRDLSALIKQLGYGSMTAGKEILTPCYADYALSYVVNYNGDVFKCTARNFKHEGRMGTLAKDGTVIDTSNAILYQDRRYYAECDECKMLPLCTVCVQKRIEGIKDEMCEQTSKKRKVIHDMLVDRFKLQYQYS